MKKTISNFKKIILTILFTIITLIIIGLLTHITRNTIIINRLSNLLKTNVNTTNYHYEETIKHGDMNIIKEQYKKDNKYVEYTYVKSGKNSNITTQYSDEKEIITIDANKLEIDKENISNKKDEAHTIDKVLAYSTSILENLSLGEIINTKIHLSKNHNAYILNNEILEIWYDIDTGLPKTLIMEYGVYTYTFEFNKVTEADVTLPDDLT